MSSSVSATDKVRAQQSNLAKREEAGREPDRSPVSESLQTSRQAVSSFSVALSEDALERMLAAREALSRFAIESAQSREDYARGQVERIKERIETLKKLLMMLGDSAARAILREIKQLAGELGAAASVLREGGGGSGAGVTVPPVQATGEVATATPDTAAADAGVGVVGQAAATQDPGAGHEAGTGSQANTAAPTPSASAAAAMYAAVASTQVASGAAASGAAASGADASGADASGAATAAAGAASASDDTAGADADDTSTQVNAQARSAQARQAEAAQRREDAKSLEEALRALKALLAMAQAKIREGDEAARRDAEIAAREIGEIAQDVTALGLSGLPGGVDISAVPGIAP